MQFLMPDHAGYPYWLSLREGAPALYADGPLPPGRRYVCFAGTRRASAHARDQAYRWALRLSRWGWTVVTTDEKGCDRSAMLGALEGGGMPVVVLASGLAGSLWRGCVRVSPFPPGTRKSADTCRARNTVTSGLARFTIIVQAPLLSGAYLVAREALDQGRDVLLLPPALDSAWGRRLREEGAPVLLDGRNADTFVVG